MTAVVVLGLGAMGGPMAQNLARAGCLAAAWNRTAQRAEALGLPDAVLRPPSAEAAAACADVLLLSLSRDADVLEVTRRCAAGLRAGSIVVDTSTVSAETARLAARELAEREVGFLDAPVSGGVEGARQGTLAMMVGGDAALLDRVRPVLAHVAGKILHMGPSGSGQATKAVNQIMAAGIAEAVAEALAFGTALGLDMDKVIEVVSSGAAGNWFLDRRGHSMVAGRYTPGFKLSLHHKDLGIARAMAQEAAAQLPVVELAMTDYERLMRLGYGDEDISALYRLRAARASN